MPRYRAPTIQELGGLKEYLPSIGVDYTEFKRLKATPGITKTAMASLLSKGRPKPFQISTILNWWREDDKENEGNVHAKDSTN